MIITGAVFLVVAIAVISVIQMGPLHFWYKCGYVLGTTFSAALFRILLLCPTIHSAALEKQSLSLIAAIAAGVVSFGSSMLTNKIKIP